MSTNSLNIFMREQYPYIGNPLGFELRKKRLATFPIITHWEEFSKEDKIIIKNIKKIVELHLGLCTMYVYGSRVAGNWLRDSDYDIIIEKKLSIEDISKIKNLDYSVKVDFKYYEQVKEFIKEAVLIK